MPDRGPESDAIDISELLDHRPWVGYQKWLILLTAITIIFDGIDNQLLGVAVPTIVSEWSTTRAAFAPVVSAGYLGMMVGGAFAGLAGDRFGRRTALLSSVAVFGAMTACAALAGDISSLAVLRFLAGVGLGGAMPNAATLAAEYVPRERRAFAVTLAIVCVPAGATAAGLLGIRLLPLLGWRLLFVVGGGVPLLAAVLLRWAMPESPRYLVRHPARWPELTAFLQRLGHRVPAAARYVDRTEHVAVHAPVRTLFKQPWRHDTLALSASFFLCLFAVYLGISWLPSMLAGAGFGPAMASTGITMFNLGGVAGALAGSVLISRVGSRPAMLAMTIGAVAGAVTLSAMPINSSAAIMPILVALTITGGLINAVQTTMYAVATHVYPASVRATGVGTAVAVGRIGSVVAGLAGAWALEFRGSQSFFGLMAAAMVLCAITLAIIHRQVPGSRESQGSA